MSAATDALLSKTDAELRFFLDNPQFYQPELVSAARRELQRRGVATTAAAPAAPVAYPTPPPLAAPDFAADYLGEPAERRPLLVPLLIVLSVVAAGLGLYWYFSAAQNRQALASTTAAKLSPDSLKLESVAATPLPTVDADAFITRQLAVVPAAERRRATPQQMQQYRGVSRRFWQAEQPTEFLLNLANSGQVTSYALLVDQIRFAEQQWHTSGNALVYTYRFPPTMADQVDRMRAVADLERKILDHVKAQAILNNPLRLSDKDQMDYATARELLHGVTHELRTLEAK